MTRDDLGAGGILPPGDGSARPFADGDAGGGAYIPLSPARRTRNIEILREAARRLNEDEE